MARRARFTLVVTHDNTDPTVKGPYRSKKAAERAWTALKGTWDDWDWGHYTGHDISKASAEAKACPVTGSCQYCEREKAVSVVTSRDGRKWTMCEKCWAETFGSLPERA